MPNKNANIFNKFKFNSLYFLNGCLNLFYSTEYASDNLYILDTDRRVIEIYSPKSQKRAEVYKFAHEEIPISFCLMPDYG